MDNITVIVEDYPQEITVQVVTTGITVDQANQIIANTQKVGYTDALVSANSDVVANIAKVGITTQQSNDIVTNNNKVGITTQQASDIITNNGKVGITTSQANDIITNNAKVGITTQQTSDITTNNAKVSDINHVTLDLPNVDNTSDLNKPISTATQSALNLKVDKTQDTINTQNTFKSVSFAMDYSDRVRDDSGNVESRDCVMNEYLKMIN